MVSVTSGCRRLVAVQVASCTCVDVSDTTPRCSWRSFACARLTARPWRKFAPPNPNKLGPVPEVDDGRPKEKDFEVKNAQPSCRGMEAAIIFAQLLPAMF